MTSLITFTCYGCHLHGIESGSVDRDHQTYGSPMVVKDRGRTSAALKRMNQPPYCLDQPRREAVLAAILDVCAHRDWGLLAAHVRSTHVHIVVSAEASPERVMIDFKAYASRRLDGLSLDGEHRNRWTRHGSTRRLWKPEQVTAAVHYVIEEQGEAMSVYSAP